MTPRSGSSGSKPRWHSPTVSSFSLKDTIYELWRRGRLEFLLRDYQKDMRDAARKSVNRKYFSLCSRRIGKSTTGLIDSLEEAKSGKDIRYCFPTLHQAESVIVPMMEEVLATCPPEFRPAFSAKSLSWEYPEGVIRLGGADSRRSANRLRGTGCNKFVMDEACFFEEYDYVLKDIALPQVFTSNGKVWFLSTPPESPAHSSVKTINECRVMGDYSHHTIWVTEPYYGKERIEQFIIEAGGEESTTARREYYAEIVTDSSKAVVPEFQQNFQYVVGELPIPTHSKKIVAADFGFRDLTAVVFGYYDFERSKIVICDEVVAEAQSALEVGKRIRAKQAELGWMDTYMVADAPPQLLADIFEACGIVFGPAKKDDNEAAINYLRRCCTEHRIMVHPKCKHTIAHLQNAVWNNSRTSFERSGEFGHFDFVDAVKYLCRHVNQFENPFPSIYAGLSRNTHWMNPGALATQENPIAKAFRWK